MARQALDTYPGLIPLAGSPDYYMQIGTVSFADNATDVTVTTSLTHDIAAIACYNVAGSTWGANVATDGSLALSIAVSGGTATISRPNTSAAALALGTDAKVTYQLVGRIFSTD